MIYLKFVKFTGSLYFPIEQKAFEKSVKKTIFNWRNLSF